MTEQEVASFKLELRNFTGSEQHFFNRMWREFRYTEGVKCVLERCAAYWFLDKIFSNVRYNSVLKQEEFQSWKLVVQPNKTAQITATDGDDNVLFNESLEYTDFPLPEMTFWLESNVLILPSEH